MAAPMETMLEDDTESWEIDPITEQIVMRKMRRCINELESSQFYHNLRDQLRNPPISEHLQKVLGSESKMEMVIYYVGRIEYHEDSRWQLSLAILMKKDFEWIGDIKVLDPRLSEIECEILEALDCSVLLFNDYGEREAMKPTMFFMPICDFTKLNSLLRANWTPCLLSNIVLLGGSLKDSYENNLTHVLTAKKFTFDFLIKHDHYDAFEDLSWQFFSPVVQTQLLCMDDYALNGGSTESSDDGEICTGLTNYRVDFVEEKAFSEKVVIRYMEKLEISKFYRVLREKLQSAPISELLHKILGESKMQIVMYGVRQLKDDVLLHLSLALLMKKDFEWVEEIQLYYRSVSKSERRVLETLGCSVLSHGRYRMPQALQPTMFFLQDCPLEFYNMILKANWKSNLLSNMVVLCGKGFDECMQYCVHSSNSIINEPKSRMGSLISRKMGHIIAAQTFTDDFKFRKLFDDHPTFQNSSCWEDYYDAFYHSTCQFLGTVPDTTLQSMKAVIRSGGLYI